MWRLFRPLPGMIGGTAVGYVPVVGHLPEAGGALDQGSWLLDAFQYLSTLKADEPSLLPPGATTRPLPQR